MGRLPWSFYVQVVVCASLWGSAFPVIKLSYDRLGIEGLGERLLFAGTRFTLAGMLVMLFCRRSVWDSFCRMPKASLLWVTLGQTYFQYLFFYYALSVSSGTLGSLLVGAGSLWWVILAPLFLNSPFPSARQWLALAGCVAGIVMAVYAPGAGSGNVALGTAGFLLASFSGALGATGLKRISLEFGSRTVTALSLFGGGLLLTVSGAGSWDGYWDEASVALLGVTGYLAALSATAFTLWNRLIEHYSVNVLSAYRFLIPFFGVIESALLVEGETIGLGIVAGGTLILASLYAVSRGNSA